MFVIDLNSIFEIEGSIQKARIVSNLWVHKALPL